MTETNFNRERLQWLNAISKDCAINCTSFKIAHAICDHLNTTSETAWPSHTRIAIRTCLSPKSIQRAVGQLERRGWLSVSRHRSRTNRYRMSWANGTKPQKAVSTKDGADKSVPDPRQICPSPPDRNVHQTYSNNLPRTYSSGLGERRSRQAQNDRGTYEQKIADRFGPDMWELFGALHDRDPKLVDTLCKLERMGQLQPSHIENARLNLKLDKAIAKGKGARHALSR